jgi:hypothetical protein
LHQQRDLCHHSCPSRGVYRHLPQLSSALRSDSSAYETLQSSLPSVIYNPIIGFSLPVKRHTFPRTLPETDPRTGATQSTPKANYAQQWPGNKHILPSKHVLPAKHLTGDQGQMCPVVHMQHARCVTQHFTYCFTSHTFGTSRTLLHVCWYQAVGLGHRSDW